MLLNGSVNNKCTANVYANININKQLTLTF